MRKIVSILAVLMATGASAFAQPGLNGTWRVDGSGASLPWTLVLRVAGSRLIGLVSQCANSTVQIYDGHVTQNTVAFKCHGGGDNSRTISFTGILNQDELALTWELQLAPGALSVSTANRMFGPLAPKRVIARRVPDDEWAELFDQTPGRELAVALNLPEKNVKLTGTLFLPQHVGRVRAVIVAPQWGLGFRFYQERVVRKLLDATDAGLLLATVTKISNQPTDLSELDADFGAGEGLVVLLQRLASESAHPELSDVPLLFWGHSGGAVFGRTFAKIYPKRTIALVGYQGGSVPAPDLKALSRIPALFFADSEGAKVLAGPEWAFWRDGRSMGAPWTLAAQRDAPHGNPDYFRRAHALALPWITAVLRQRLSEDGKVLVLVTDQGGWLGTNQTGEIAPYASFSKPKAEANWLPDEPSARGWQVVNEMPK